MARKKRQISLGGKKFFSMVVLSSLALGLIVTTFALQQPTNTESEASGCLRKPSVTLLSTSGSANSVTYRIRVKNTAPRSCTTKRTYYLSSTFPSKNWTGTFINKNGNVVNRAWNLAGQGSKEYRFVAKPNSRVRNGYHTIYVGVSDVEFPRYRNTISLSYYKD